MSDTQYNNSIPPNLPLVVANIPGKDMSTAINNALMAARKENCAVHLNSGTYIVDSPIIVPSNSKLLGYSSGDGIGMDKQNSTILTGSANPMMRLCDSFLDRSGFDVTMKDMWLLGKDGTRQVGLTTTCEDGKGFRSSMLENINIRNFSINYHIGGNSYHLKSEILFQE